MPKTSSEGLTRRRRRSHQATVGPVTSSSIPSPSMTCGWNGVGHLLRGPDESDRDRHPCLVMWSSRRNDPRDGTSAGAVAGQGPPVFLLAPSIGSFTTRLDSGHTRSVPESCSPPTKWSRACSWEPVPKRITTDSDVAWTESSAPSTASPSLDHTNLIGTEPGVPK